jgi:DNA-binding MarR family transcriptional regulator
VNELAPEDYVALARFRRGLRAFLNFSSEAARAEGLAPAQHQLLLAIKAATVAGPADGPMIGDMAEWLVLHHNSAVELVDRAAAAGLVVRTADPLDARCQRLALTAAGEEKLARLSEQHRGELRRLREETFADLWSLR